MTSSEHYGHLNERFEVRSKELRAMGFVYTHVPEWDTAVFAKKHPSKKVPYTVPAPFVMHADDLCWTDRIAELKRL